MSQLLGRNLPLKTVDDARSFHVICLHLQRLSDYRGTCFGCIARYWRFSIAYMLVIAFISMSTLQVDPG
ncbi:hypothetical protein IQ07DRAFT_397710 [Pyrenochaeta sp. DS3sAY3a]|nr:hypothetical protein IQ07DRAFT_397710 [Pyrenochaeta sp. DS3sAY3a]